MVKSSRVFHRERRKHHVGLEKGFVMLFWSIYLIPRDAYSSVKYIRLMALQKDAENLEAKKNKSKKENQALTEMKKEIETLQAFLDDAKKQRAAIKGEICMLFIFLLLIF